MKWDISDKSYPTIINLLQKKKSGQLRNLLDIKVFLIYI